MVDQRADVTTARAKTDSLLDRGHKPRRILRKQTRYSARTATRNAPKFDEESLHSRDAQARVVKETFPPGAALAPRLTSKRLVYYSVSLTRLPIRVVATRQRTASTDIGGLESFSTSKQIGDERNYTVSTVRRKPVSLIFQTIN